MLTCLQVLPVLEKEEKPDHNFRANITQAYDLMRQKILFLGKLTGVYYNRDQTQQEKYIVGQLRTGFGKFTMNKNTAVKLIEAALESKENFENFYIEITKACIDKYKDIDRKHSKMFVEIDLAKFYLQHGYYINAEPLLEICWSIYKQQKWETLYTDVLIPLAACQLKHELHDRYLTSVTLLSCASCLSFDTRDFYSKEVVRLSKDDKLSLPTVSCDPAVRIISIKVNLVKMKGHIGDNVEVNVTLANELTMPIHCQKITINAKHLDLSNPDSFSENVLSARKSLFENRDYGMNSVSPKDKQPPKSEEPVKEALTPGNLLKRIKSHRRTWSRNRNVVDTNETKTDGVSDSETLVKKGSISENAESVKRALFSEDDSSERKTSQVDKPTNQEEMSQASEGNQEVQTNGRIAKRGSLLELAKEQKEVTDVNQQTDDKSSTTCESEAQQQGVGDEPCEEMDSKHDLSLDLTQLNEDDTSTPMRYVVRFFLKGFY